MKANVKWTVLAMAVAALTASAAASAGDSHHRGDDQNRSAWINHQHNVNETRTTTTNTINNDVNTSYDSDVDLKLDAAAKLRLDAAAKLRYDSNEVYENVDKTRNVSVTETVDKTSNIQADERKEKNNHGVDANFKRDQRLTSDIRFSGAPEITGAIDLDSAASAVIDNRQSISQNTAANSLVTNDASIADDVGSDASGNLGFNVAAGDNNAQDNAAALSAADASFSFGMSDAAVFVNQSGSGNATLNYGVTNDAGIGGNAFSGATGNLGANVASGNNNGQKNALAASVSTSAYSTAGISSNQSSSGNTVANAGYYQRMTDTVQVNLGGTVSGTTASEGSGSFTSSGNAYQSDNYYLDSWSGGLPHPSGNSTGHLDMDASIDNATMNPDKEGVGGIGFDLVGEGESEYSEMGTADLTAALSGTVTTTRWVAVDATNTASLSGSAFSGASGNIGVNVASGTGNLQANSLALAVAQPGAGGGNGE